MLRLLSSRSFALLLLQLLSSLIRHVLALLENTFVGALLRERGRRGGLVTVEGEIVVMVPRVFALAYEFANLILYRLGSNMVWSRFVRFLVSSRVLLPLTVWHEWTVHHGGLGSLEVSPAQLRRPGSLGVR